MSDNSSLPARTDLPERCAELVDDSLYAAARADAEELGATTLDAVSADFVRQVSRMIDVRAAVCITPAPGVPALAVLAATGPETVLTLIDNDPHHIEAARSALRQADYDTTTARFITARPMDVLGKLADGNYDLVVADADARTVGPLVTRCSELIRRGGALVLTGVHSPLPEEAEVPDGSHLSVLPIGSEGLTLVTF